MNETLHEFMSGRVLATRAVHDVQYPPDLSEPSPAVMLNCPADAMVIVVMPTFVGGLVHVEVHTFVDNERVDCTVIRPEEPNGCIELMLHRESRSTTV